MESRDDTQEIRRMLLEYQYKLPSLANGDEEFLGGASSGDVPVSFIIVARNKDTETALDLANSLEHPFIIHTKERLPCLLGRHQHFILVQEAIKKSLLRDMQHRSKNNHYYLDEEFQRHLKGLLEALALMADRGICHKRIGADTIFLTPNSNEMKLGCFQYCERVLDPSSTRFQEDLFALGQTFRTMRDLRYAQSGPNYYDQMIDEMTRSVYEVPTAQWLLAKYFPVPIAAAKFPPTEMPPLIDSLEEVKAANQETVRRESKSAACQVGDSLSLPAEDVTTPKPGTKTCSPPAKRNGPTHETCHCTLL